MKLTTMRRVRTTVMSLCSVVGNDEPPVVHAASTDPPASNDGPFESTTLDLPTLVVENTDFVFRNLRRAGLDTATAQDGAQQVFMIVARKLGTIAAGKERAFLYATAMNVAADLKRRASRRAETTLSDEQIDEFASGPSSSPDYALDKQRARELLDEVFSAMPEQLRDVLMLSELEEMSVSEVASCLNIPAGTVASRLARARQVFDECLTRIQARRAFRRIS
jgi:RNA polymerase sigma-70 factor (ECF subfamily)